MSPASATVADLSAGLTQLADALFQLDTSPELVLAKDPGKLTGQSAAVATEASTRAASVWERYPLLKDAVESLEAAVARGDRPAVDRLLGRSAVKLPDGTSTSPSALLAALEGDVRRARAAADKLAAAWRDVVPRLDQARSTLSATAARAADLGVDDPEIISAQGLVQQLADLATTDPLTVNPAPAERAVEAARQRVETLAAQKSTLAADLRAAGALVAELKRLIRDGRDAHALSASRIDAASGLVAPLDETVLDQGNQAIRPWLDRLVAQAEAGSWVAAATGLAQWRLAADRLRVQAEDVLAANRAPVARRNDLRGLLEAYRAKAAARGRAEDDKLTRLYGAARDALYVGPCDVGAAEAKVQEYLAAVNSPSPRDPS